MPDNPLNSLSNYSHLSPNCYARPAVKVPLIADLPAIIEEMKS